MAGSVNKVILVGNLGKDPEIRTTQGGDPVANFNVATSNSWKDKQSGEKKETTEWHRVVVFNKNKANFIQNYVKKGCKVYVEGELKTRKWTDQSGQERYTTEVVISAFVGNVELLSSPGGNNGQQQSSNNQSQQPSGNNQQQHGQQQQQQQQQNGGYGYSGGNQNQNHNQNGNGGGWEDDLDSEIPF